MLPAAQTQQACGVVFEDEGADFVFDGEVLEVAKPAVGGDQGSRIRTAFCA